MIVIKQSVHFDISTNTLCSLKLNSLLAHAYVKGVVQYTDNADDNCLAGCLDWLGVPERSPG